MSAIAYAAGVTWIVVNLAVQARRADHRRRRAGHPGLDGLPPWLGWFSLAAGSGPLAPGGWVRFLVYPVFVVWLVAVIAVMLTHDGR